MKKYTVKNPFQGTIIPRGEGFSGQPQLPGEEVTYDIDDEVVDDVVANLRSWLGDDSVVEAVPEDKKPAPRGPVDDPAMLTRPVLPVDPETDQAIAPVEGKVKPEKPDFVKVEVKVDPDPVTVTQEKPVEDSSPTAPLEPMEQPVEREAEPPEGTPDPEPEPEPEEKKKPRRRRVKKQVQED